MLSRKDRLNGTSTRPEQATRGECGRIDQISKKNPPSFGEPATTGE